MSRARRLVFAAVAVVTALGTIGSALSPWLLVRHPLLLVALSPDVRHLILVAPQLPFLPVLVVGVLRRAAGLGTMYALGSLYGPLAIPWFEQQAPRLGKAIRWLERLFARLGAPLLVIFPIYSLGALAGAAGTRLKVFIAAMLAGQTLYVTSGYYFGDAIRGWTQPLLRFLGEHLVASTAVCLGAVALQQLWSRRGREVESSGPPP